MPKLLFFTRGRGRGHAIPDIELARELVRIRPDLHLQFASYAMGVTTLRAAGFSVIDMQLSDEAGYLESIVAAIRTISNERPGLVVSHEEFAALPVAKSFSLPTILIVDFFSPVQTLWSESSQYADEVLFIERRGIFPEPPWLRGRIRYVGPLVRPLAVTRNDRLRMRAELDLPVDAKVVSVIPGSWATEERAPVFELVIPAFRGLPYGRKKLIWVAGRDIEKLAARTGGVEDITLIGEFSPIEKLMVASDLVVTKGNRGTTIELASLGVPAVSLSFGLNVIDEMITWRIPTNTALNARGVDAECLRDAIHGAMAADDSIAYLPSAEYAPGGAMRAAAELATIIHERSIGDRP
jgi:UDP:flavonoid glycosyltransferase YjiC (YdhE family)